MLTTRYRDELAHTLTIIKTEGPRTARQLADRLDLCKPAAYARIRALIERGQVVECGAVRDGKTGPRAASYAAQGGN